MQATACHSDTAVSRCPNAAHAAHAAKGSKAVCSRLCAIVPTSSRVPFILAALAAIPVQAAEGSGSRPVAGVCCAGGVCTIEKAVQLLTRVLDARTKREVLQRCVHVARIQLRSPAAHHGSHIY